ncbi:MAG: aspartate aminotransferase family protein [Pseudomonadota bacterium]
MTAIRANYDAARLRRLDAEHHIHPFSNARQVVEQGGGRLYAHADGVYIYDVENKRYLDGMAGLWCVNVGYGREELVEAAARQMREFPYYSSFFGGTTPPTVELAAKLTELLGHGLNHVMFANSGSEANDSVVRIVRHYWNLVGRPGKKTFIARRHAYHGSTMASASLGCWGPMHLQADLPLPGFVHVEAPYWYGEGGDSDPEAFALARARAIETKILELGPENVAAVIGEPVQGAGGVIVPHPSYWPEVERICRTYDVLLISDEVICGFGRTGNWFGFETMGFTPDIVSMAKGLSSGYQPISAVAMTDRIAGPLIEAGYWLHGFTYSGHPVAAAVALKNIEIIERERLVERVRSETGPYFAERLKTLEQSPIVGEVRTLGLLGGIELVADKKTRTRFEPLGMAGDLCRERCLANGLIMRASFETMVLSPPLTITKAEIDELVTLAGRALQETAQALGQ